MRHGSGLRTGDLKTSMVMRLKIYIRANVASVLKASPRSRFFGDDTWTVGEPSKLAQAMRVFAILNPGTLVGVRSRSMVHERVWGGRAGIREGTTKVSVCAKETSHQDIGLNP